MTDLDAQARTSLLSSVAIRTRVWFAVATADCSLGKGAKAPRVQKQAVPNRGTQTGKVEEAKKRRPKSSFSRSRRETDLGKQDEKEAGAIGTSACREATQCIDSRVSL